MDRHVVGATVADVPVPHKIARHAAGVAARHLGLAGDVVHLGTSMAVTFAATTAILRVTDDPGTADATLAVAAVAEQLTFSARPLQTQAVRVPSGAGQVAVEAYERIIEVRLATPADVGAALAALHATAPEPVTGALLRNQVRLATSRARLEPLLATPTSAWHAEAHMLTDGLGALMALASSLDTPCRLVHMDAAVDNVLVGAHGPAWIDWEYGGVGPAALDVAFAVGGAWRSEGPESAAALLSAYRAAGGVAPAEHVVLLLAVRDVVGAADVFPPRPGSAWQRLARQRLDSLGEATRHTRWEPLASLH